MRKFPFVLLCFLLVSGVSAGAREEKITLLVDESYFTRVHELLQNARKSVHLAIFNIRRYPNYPDSPSNVLIEDLIGAKKRGLEVYVLINVDDWQKDNERNRAAGDLLEKGGVTVRYDSLKRITHAKLLTVDGKFAVLGSTNWTYHSLTKNHEANALISDAETARELTEYILSIR